MKTVALFTLLLICHFQIKAQMVLPESKHKFIVIAHRGDHVEVPENTIASFEHAIKNTVDYVEIDLRTTKDSVLVIMHDNTVDRMTNGTGKVSDLTFAQLTRLSVIDKAKDSTKKYPVPIFEDVLKTCRNKIHIYLDYKSANVAQTYQLIKKYGMEDQIIVYINAPSQYTDWRKIAPEMPLMLSLPNDVKTPDDLNRFLLATPVTLLDGDYSDYTPAVFQSAVKAGIPAWPDIQGPNEANNWAIAIKMGFRGLQTDHPAALIEYLKKNGLR